jgi:hypothetical protein
MQLIQLQLTKFNIKDDIVKNSSLIKQRNCYKVRNLSGIPDSSGMKSLSIRLSHQFIITGWRRGLTHTRDIETILHQRTAKKKKKRNVRVEKDIKDAHVLI